MVIRGGKRPVVVDKCSHNARSLDFNAFRSTTPPTSVMGRAKRSETDDFIILRLASVPIPPLRGANRPAQLLHVASLTWVRGYRLSACRSLTLNHFSGRIINFAKRMNHPSNGESDGSKCSYGSTTNRENLYVPEPTYSAEYLSNLAVSPTFGDLLTS